MTAFRSIKTEALVMGSMRLGDADRIVRLYTRERGRVSAVAKGVRRALSRIGGRLEPFSVVHVVLHPGRSLYTVTGVETIRAMAEMREALFRIEAGGRLMEAASRLLAGEESNPGAFNLLVRTVGRLARAQDAAEAQLVEVSGVAKLILLQGFAPELTCCVSCGRETDLVAFSPGDGGAVCGACLSSSAPQGREAGGECLHAFRTLLECPLGELPRDLLGEELVMQVGRLARHIIREHAM